MISQKLIEETVRYLGVCQASPDETLMALVKQAIGRVDAAANKQHIVHQVVCRADRDGVWLDDHFVKSVSLANHLAGCERAYLFASTLGAEVDRLLRRDTILHPSLALAEQAAAAALIEQYSDEACKAIEAKLKKGHLRPRFSPGYEDLTLEEQKYILHSLEAYKHMGLTHTDAFMLTPSKSITAVIGVAADASRCYASGCQMCAKTDCLFRKA